MHLNHQTEWGNYYCGDSVQALQGQFGQNLKGKIQLIFTSPPFLLNKKKSYGNRQGEDYKHWFINLASLWTDLLTEDGSIVVEIGNAWEPGRPIQSSLHLESLLGFLNHPAAGLKLCQQFVCYNPCRLPSPAQWVTIHRIRLTDSYTHLWWFSKSDYPKANNARILKDYSPSMKKLQHKGYSSGAKRASQHMMKENSFVKDNGGSIRHNFFETEKTEGMIALPNAFRLPNTSSNDYFLRTCRERNIKPHPARMQTALAETFIQFLTEPGDLVFDPFGGSNTTGFAAEKNNRRWISVEAVSDYALQSQIRLSDPSLVRKNNYEIE